MILTLVRTKSTPEYTVGKLFIDGKLECFTLEDPFRKKKIQGQTRIGSGVYNILLRFSPKFTPRYAHNMLWVSEVENFEYILIHPGNTVDDTDGCILVGQKEDKGTLANSRIAYFGLYDKVSPAANKKELSMVIIDL